MTISDYQISNVIKTYMRNLKVKTGHMDRRQEGRARDDSVSISEEAMQRMLIERIEEKMTERSKQNGQST